MLYRIGGDEFTVILKDNDLVDHENLINAFESGIEKQADSKNIELPISIALGISHYQAGDTDFSDVFNRADKAMYQKKMAMKTK